MSARAARSSTSTRRSPWSTSRPGLVVHPAPSHSGPTLVDELGDLLGGGADPERPGIVHRLDKGTSGLLVVARSDEAHAALQAQVQRREVERVYLALGARPARLAHRHDRRPDRPRLAPAPPDGGLRRRLARGPHPLHGARAARRRDLPRGPPGDRPHPPDPRPLRRDRPPAGRRRRPTAARRATASSASSSTPTGSPSTTRCSGERLELRAPSCRPTSPPRCDAARAA